jgi:hypothetical protein
MTTEENTQPDEKIVLDPLLAQILTANVKWSADLNDRVLDNKDREITKWQSLFLKLYEAIETANTKVDSLRIEKELQRFAYDADTACQALDAK